jgi:hypothetical protein
VAAATQNNTTRTLSALTDRRMRDIKHFFLGKGNIYLQNLKKKKMLLNSAESIPSCKRHSCDIAVMQTTHWSRVTEQ